MAPSLKRSRPPALDPIPFVRGLHQLIPEGRLAAILAQAGRASERRRRLPAGSVIWLVIAMALFAADSIPKVRRRLHPGRDEPEPAESAFARARARLGVAPLRHLFLRAARPMAIHQTKGATHAGWRLMGIDGTTLDMPDTPADARASGRPASGRGAGAFPQVRLLAVCELGTHAACGLAIKPPRRGEPPMVGQLLDQLGPGMLLVRDRGFFGYDPARPICSSGAHPLARVESNGRLDPLRRLDGGSYTAELYPSPIDRHRDTSGLVVRAIEYTHDDPNRPGAGRRHRLVTDVLNPADLPAAEAPLICHEGREQELAFDEIETHPGGRAVTIRSETPAGVVQGVYGLMPAHRVVRRVMHGAAVVAMHDPDRLCSTDSLRVIRCRLPGSPRLGVQDWYRLPLEEIRRQVLRARRDRWYARVIEQKMPRWKRERPEHPRPPRPTKAFWDAVVLLI